MLMFTLCAMLLFTAVPMGLAAKDSIGCDTVIVLDASGSMGKTSDAKRVAIDAANMYVDCTESQDSSVAFIAFSDKIKVCMDFVKTDTVSNRNRLHDAINAVEYKGSTDIGLAMKEAEDLITARKEKYPNRPIIVVFLSDGKTSFKSDIRTVEQSNAELEETVTEFEKIGVKVYAIGLDADGTYTNDETLNHISDVTAGFARYTHDADELMPILTEIFASAQGGLEREAVTEIKAGKWYTYEFGVSSPSILETNVIVRYDRDLRIKLKRPDGTEVDLEKDEDIMFSKQKNYASIKMTRPEVGEWALRMKSDRTCTVRLLFTDFYNMSVEMGFTDVDTGREITDFSSPLHLHDFAVTAKLAVSEGDIGNEIYEDVIGTLIVKDPEGDTEEFEMEYDDSKEMMIAAVDAGAYNGIYTFWCELKSGDIEWTTEGSQIEFINSAPIAKGKGPIKFKVDKSKGEATFEKIGDYFVDTDGDAIQVTLLEDKGTKCTATEKSGTLYLKDVTEDTFIILLVADMHGAASEIKVEVVVENVLMNILIIASVVLLAAILIAVIVKTTIDRAKGALMGDIVVHISDEYEEKSASGYITAGRSKNGKRVPLISIVEPTMPELQGITIGAVERGRKCCIITANKRTYTIEQGDSAYVDLSNGGNATIEWQ